MLWSPNSYCLLHDRETIETQVAGAMNNLIPKTKRHIANMTKNRCSLHAKSLQLCPTLCNPMDCSLPGSSVHGILQARMLEWAAMASFRGSSHPRDRTSISYLCIAGRTTRTSMEALSTGNSTEVRT